MHVSQAVWCVGRVRAYARRRHGFTAIELLVVVLVVVLLAGTVMPALARLREGERTRACLGNLKLLGYGISAFAEDHAGTLPGPTPLTVYGNVARFLLPNDTPEWSWYRHQLTAFLEPYVGGAAGDARPADAVPFCPTAEGIPVARATGGFPGFQPRLYYVLNTVGGRNRQRLPVPDAPTYPYYGTDPPYYFGRANTPWSPPPDGIPPEDQPKKLEAIANHAGEWALADVWYWDGSYGPFSGTGLFGTWPYPVMSSTTPSIVHKDQLRVPSYPFHLTTKTFSPDLNSPDHQLGSPRLTSGKTNAVFFDGHAASVSPWLGTVNPALR